MSEKEIIEVVQAHMEGKEIEARARWGKPDFHKGWYSVEPNWDFYNVDFRVKPEPRKPREWKVRLCEDGTIEGPPEPWDAPLIIVREVIE